MKQNGPTVSALHYIIAGDEAGAVLRPAGKADCGFVDALAVVGRLRRLVPNQQLAAAPAVVLLGWRWKGI